MNTVPSRNLLIICPCFNEEFSIGSIINEIECLDEGYDIVVVDDGSVDNTYEVASAKVVTLRLPVNLGIGGAVQTGYLYAERHGYQYAIQIDGDGQHDPAYIKDLLEVMKREDADLVIGSRYLEKVGFQSSSMRRIGARVIAGFTKLLFGYQPSDPTSGMRLANRKLIEAFCKNYPTDYPEPLSVCFALHHGYHIVEEPVIMRERRAGTSSIVGIKTILYMISIILRISAQRVAKGDGQ